MIQGTGLLFCAAGYFALLLLLSFLTGRNSSNDAFFRGNRQSKWWAVAFGMIGASVSGVTFVSVPGMVSGSAMSYIQMCMGFVIGYALVAFVLLPIYYRLNLTTIYTYLDHRFGHTPYLTGSVFFFISKLIGASIRLFLVCEILQILIFDHYGIPFGLNTAIMLLLMWLYTRRSGIRTIVWSDCLQTLVLLVALVLIIFQLCNQLEWGFVQTLHEVWDSPMSRIIMLDDPNSRHYFWKQFVSGIFVVVVMTGLDQDAMQKNLTCRNLHESQLNMCVNGLFYLPVNILFMSLGVIMVIYTAQTGLQLPSGDALLPALCSGGYLGNGALICFTLGIIAAAFSSADSAMASLTTSFCVDIARRPNDERLRKWVHPGIGLLFWVFIMIVKAVNSTSVIDAVYTVCSYTYGPLLGLFAFGLLTKRQPAHKLVPIICMVSPVICYVTDWLVSSHIGYRFGYELLVFNGLLTYMMLLASSAKFRTDNACGNGHVQTLRG